MKIKLVTAAVLTSFLAAPAFAGGNYRYAGASGNASANNVSYDYATVIESAPIIKTVRVSTPRE
ncbi:MAG: hypothetical protein WD994_04750, partial [Pseudomonadales bacterium]